MGLQDTMAGEPEAEKNGAMLLAAVVQRILPQHLEPLLPLELLPVR